MDNKTTSLIIGMGRSGQALKKWLDYKGCPILCYDDSDTLNYKITEIPWEKIARVILSPGVPFQFPKPHPLIKKAKDLKIPIISDLNLFQVYFPHIPIIGITGTNGKTTTTALINHIFQTLKPNGALMGGNCGIPVFDLAHQVKEDSLAIFELSSFQLECSDPLHLETVAWTNFSYDHPDHYPTNEDYLEAKKKIFQDFEQAIIVIDDPFSKALYDFYKSKSFSASLCNLKAHFYMEEGRIHEEGAFVGALPLKGYLKGPHNQQNALLSYAVVRHHGFDTNLILDALSTFKNVSHRQEEINKKGNILFVNDSKATNEDAVKKAIEAYKNTKILWLGGGRLKKYPLDCLLPFLKGIDSAFLFGESEEMLFNYCKGIERTLCHDLNNALKEAYKKALSLEGQVTILFSPLGSSFDHFKNFEERGNCFKEAVEELLKSF